MKTHALAYYFKPSTRLDRMPRKHVVKGLAEALGCEPIEVVEAFALDVGMPWKEPPLSAQDADLLRKVQRLWSTNRETVRVMVDRLLQAQDEIAAQPGQGLDPLQDQDRPSDGAAGGRT